jgi:RHS repeat-associated protein
VFEYDAAGSLGSVLHDLAQVGRGATWTMREGNVLLETHEATYENDVHGRRTRRADKKTRQETQYSWDCRDQLREVQLGDGRRVRYTYDAFGRRVRKEILGPQGKSVTEFIWDKEVLAAELGREGGPRVFVHAPGSFTPMLQQEQGSVFAYVNDHHGMPKELIGEDGRVAWSAAHSAWGEVLEVWRDPGARWTVETPFRMLGQYLDEETGLCYTRFRYFDAEVGRWLSPDPLGIRGGPNLLGWDGNPVNDVDPRGLVTGSCPPRGLGGRTLTPDEQAQFDAFGQRAQAAGLVESPYRTGSWGKIDPVTGKYQEVTRIDVAEAGQPGWRGQTHMHVAGQEGHLPLSTPIPGE